MYRIAIILLFSFPVIMKAKPSLNPVMFKQAPKHEIVKLVIDNKPNAAVMIPGNNPEAEKAAKELIHFVELSTRARMPLLKENAENPYPNVILIGSGKRTEELRINADDLPLEGFRIKSFPQGIAIVGRPATQEEKQWNKKNDALLFGVYDFLERYLGIRWYYPGPDGMVIPKHNSLLVASVHYTDKPWLKKRILFPENISNMKGIDLSSHLKRCRVGDSHRVKHGCHTPCRVDMHFQKHPECYEMRKDGSRNQEMLCYGNPKTVDLLLQDFIDYYENKSKAPWTTKSGDIWLPPTVTTMILSPPDKSIDCHCKYCAKLFEPDKDLIARAGKLMAQFVAAFARKAQRIYPEKTVFYLPYCNYTVPPENFKMPDNVKVMICMMRGAGNYKEDSARRDHDNLVDIWSRITNKKVMVWEYMCWPSLDTALPYQYPHVIQKFYRKNRDKLDGSFINGAAGPKQLYGRFWAFITPTIYCWLRLQWNPDFDVDAALNEYYRLMYGPAEKEMRQIFTLLTDRWEQVKWSKPLYGWHVSPKQIHEETMPLEKVTKLQKDLETARLKAGMKTVYRRRIEFFANALNYFFEESRNYNDVSSIPIMNVIKVGGNPLVDGKLDDLYWNDTPKYHFKNAVKNIDIPPRKPTTIQAVWTEQGITFGFYMNEPDTDKIKKIFTKHDQDVYRDDCVELFLDTAGNRSRYTQIVVNSLGTVFDTMFGKGKKFNMAGMKTAGYIGNDFWSCEVYIPFKSLSTIVKIGTHWYGNFTCSRYTGRVPNLQRWNTRGASSNLDFGAFGIIKFTE